MSSLAPWVVAPVVLPMVASALLLLMGDARRRSGAIVNVAATALGLGIAGWLLWRVDAQAGPGAIAVHIAANWPAPFGIALVADRLSALMLVLVGLVGLGSALYATAGWSRVLSRKLRSSRAMRRSIGCWLPTKRSSTAPLSSSSGVPARHS